MKKKRMIKIFNICVILLFDLIGLLVCTGTWKRLVSKEKTVTVGVFSDSYWGVQNGHAYQILEDAIADFENKNPDVQVKYVSGILKEDYSEWLAEHVLSGDAPDVFFILGEDFNDLAELGVLKDLDATIKKHLYNVKARCNA